MQIRKSEGRKGITVHIITNGARSRKTEIKSSSLNENLIYLVFIINIELKLIKLENKWAVNI